MNIVNKLTWRHMLQNKQRTLVTIIGVIISVAMITAVATLASSFLKFAQQEHIATEGEWHVAFKDVDSEQLQGIKDDENSDRIIISRELGYADLQGSQNESKPYLFIQQYNDIGFQQFPIELISGRLQENDRELLISEHILTNGQVDLAIDDKLTLDIGQRVTTDEDFIGYELGQTFRLLVDEDVTESVEPVEQHEYTIVGVMQRPEWEPYFAPGYTVLSYISEDNVTEENHADVLIVWDKVKMNKVKSSEKLGEALKIDEVIPNEYLLRYYGISKHEFLLGAVYSVVAIIMTVIIAGSISLIYNAFAISVSECSRQLGMVSRVGATMHK